MNLFGVFLAVLGGLAVIAALIYKTMTARYIISRAYRFLSR